MLVCCQYLFAVSFCRCFPNLARGFQSLARDFRFECLCLELRVFCFSDLSALDINVMCVHVFILVLMGSLTSLQPWVGLACSTCMRMQPLLIIMNNTYNNNTHLISSHRILSLSHLYPLLLSLSLSLSLSFSRISISINIITITSAYQHISSTSAAHQQHISTSAHQHISTITTASSASSAPHQTGSL